MQLAPDDGFLVLGGTELNEKRDILSDKFLPVDKRDIDVIFTGNYTPVNSFDRFIAHLDSDYQEFYRGLVRKLIENPEMIVEDAAEEELKNQGIQFTDDELKQIMPNLMFVDLSVRFYFRAEVIARLADSGIKVHTFGAGWDMLECRHPENIITAGNVSSQECLDMISRSKISVNVMPWFKQGAHDRVFNSMLNGAVCVTDTSGYLKDNFIDGENIIFYNLENIDAAADKIKRLLTNHDELEHIAENAYKICAENHKWEMRTNKVIEWMNLTV